MSGLRKLTQTIIEEGRTPAVEIPESCEKYIDSAVHCYLRITMSEDISDLDKQYLRHPEPPLVVNPFACLMLSESALRCNLEAHASVNPSILASGTREEMVKRLMKILERRKLDQLVYSLFTELGDDDT